MNRLILVLAICAVSCTKTKTVTIPCTPPVNPIIGKWHNDFYTNHNPTFSTDTLLFAATPYAYLRTADTIYLRGYYGYSAGFYYRVKGDTLTMKAIAPLMQPTLDYYRIK